MGERIDIEQGTDEWLLARQQGIGASDVAALFEASPYKTERDLFFEKAGFGDAMDESKEWIFSKGHAIEKEIRKIYLEKLGVEMTPAFYKHEEIFLASLDGINDSEGILEAKYTGKDNIKKAKLGELPVHHMLQMQQQFFVTGADKGHYVATNDGVNYISVIVRPNPKTIEQIRVKGLKFWERVLSNNPPELTAKDTMFITDADSRLKFRRLKELKLKKDDLDLEYKNLEREVKNMARHPKTSCAGVRITKYEAKGAIQYKNIPELKGADLEAYRAKSSMRTKITFGGE
jgi:putative phage-type endonuclease